MNNCCDANGECTRGHGCPCGPECKVKATRDCGVCFTEDDDGLADDMWSAIKFIAVVLIFVGAVFAIAAHSGAAYFH